MLKVEGSTPMGNVALMSHHWSEIFSEFGLLQSTAVIHAFGSTRGQEANAHIIVVGFCNI